VKIDLDVSVQEMGETISRSLTRAFASAADDALKWGSLGRTVKEQTDKAATSLVAAVLADEGFRAKAREALSAGLLAGIRVRGEKIAKGMPLQQAINLAAPLDGKGSEVKP
jgi:hypothetical protein